MEINAQLLESIQNLSPAQLQLLQRIISSFEAGVEVTVNSNSDLCAESEFSDYFANLFSIYHSITEHKFEKKSFEFAFKYASLASGYDCEINQNSSNQGEDVNRGGERISLKTEGEKTNHTFKISKFSEARFIANFKTEVEERKIPSLAGTEQDKARIKAALLAKREEELLPGLVEEFRSTVGHHLNSYDRIIGLKSQPIEKDGDVISFRYRLLEIPKQLIERALLLTVDEFKPLRGNGGTSAPVMVNGVKAFGVTLDGSVEKISITGIKISECITHAEFIVPVSV
ncbi:hypothetical protein MO867_15210 [Microbulbifer sp. OS29]|uniref:Uncharacterized protein n=1 Tax=Microbulbifer okhotskensis TaxID=2926617 RepID=A0A9X2J7D5_9GAMM|nr:hypothetical protein [Microbulbifer okhotskensis]MCO1335685.1 hypothetical protein [Microbulbifer okhotskensis]